MPRRTADIAELRKLVSFELPAEYMELLRYCNGGYGDLDAPPLLFYMDSIAESVRHNAVFHSQDFFHEFWFIGSNGGLEAIAFEPACGPAVPTGDDRLQRQRHRCADR